MNNKALIWSWAVTEEQVSRFECEELRKSFSNIGNDKMWGTIGGVSTAIVSNIGITDPLLYSYRSIANGELEIVGGVG